MCAGVKRLRILNNDLLFYTGPVFVKWVAVVRE